MNKLLSIIIPFVVVLSGCSALPSAETQSREKSGFNNNNYEQTDFFSAADNIEGERHKVVKQALTGYGDVDELREYATKKADKRCRDIGRYKTMLAISERTSVPPYVWENFPRIELTFVCVGDRIQPITTSGTVQRAPSVSGNGVYPVINQKASMFTDKYDLLLKIKALLDDGVLTQSEYESEKKKILTEEY